MKSEKYLGKTIKFVKLSKFRTSYGYAGSSRVEAYVGDACIARGRTKAEALKEAKRVLKQATIKFEVYEPQSREERERYGYDW